ncbi:hypothetical protein E4P30_17270 [Herbaspirillum sp. 3C11]|nr:hypothetical protein E4P30_17270 [Herbaspirillum sp. 3C11]
MLLFVAGLRKNCEKTGGNKPSTLQWAGQNHKQKQVKTGFFMRFSAHFWLVLHGLMREGNARKRLNTPSTMVLPNGRTTKVDGGCGRAAIVLVAYSIDTMSDQAPV